jgi:hypothetical protein
MKLLNLLRNQEWRLALCTAGVIVLIAGPMHPESDAHDSIREELATMTGNERWVPVHSLLVVSAILLATGLWLAHRNNVWPWLSRRTLLVVAIALSAYVVESIFHLAAAVDVDHLAAGEASPVAFTHLALSVVLYPVSGLAIAVLAAKQLSVWTLGQRTFAVAGMIGGVVHAVSVPMTLALPNIELSPMFAISGILIALWSISTGLVGVRSQARPALA